MQHRQAMFVDKHNDLLKMVAFDASFYRQFVCFSFAGIRVQISSCAKASMFIMQCQMSQLINVPDLMHKQN